ncbi:MAG TPA: DUF1080 domain-containing protein [Lacipirellulaceae bacterium]
MPTKFGFATVVALAFAFSSIGYTRADESVELFNGKDLSGWTKRGGDATYAIENGEIVGRSVPNTPNTFLTTDKEFGDFVLELDFKIHPKAFNSGVQIRSHARPEGNRERVYGYQVEIDTDPNRPWTGGIYFEGGSKDESGKWIRQAGWLNDLKKNEPAQKARHLGEWDHLKIMANGRRIQTWLNGVPAADFTDNDDKAFAPSGFIALQVHGVGKDRETKEVRWKNIKLTVRD